MVAPLSLSPAAYRSLLDTKAAELKQRLLVVGRFEFHKGLCRSVLADVGEMNHGLVHVHVLRLEAPHHPTCGGLRRQAPENESWSRRAAKWWMAMVVPLRNFGHRDL